VTKAGSGSGTVKSSPAGIECGATCSASFDQGSTVPLTGASGLHSQAVQWSGCTSVNILHKCLVAMSAAKSVTATFELEPGFVLYGLTITKGGTGTGTVTSSPVGIDCGSTCSTEVFSKTKVTLIATPAPGSAFSHWTGGTCSGEAPCTRTINSTRTVKAVFKAIGVRTLTITMAGTGAGIVKSKATGIECTASCSPSVVAGTKVILAAVPAAGSTFSGFSGACSGLGRCIVQLSEAQSVTATFAKVPVPSSGSGMAVIAKGAKVKGGKAFIGIRCNGPSSCRGSLRLRARLRGRGSGSAAIGSATFSLAPGSSTTLKVKLSTGAKQLLNSAGQLKARVTGVGVKARAVRLKL
jgi:Divergent InlB B-repeat domain